MVKLYFAQRENQHIVDALIDNQLSVCQVWLEMHQEQLAAVPSGSFSGVVFNYRLRQIHATLGWLQQIKAELSI
jgi:hypothetical protein